MKWTSSKENGYLTIFLALSLTVLLSLCLTLVEGARKNGARFLAEYALDVGMNSILAEYHRELLKQYDVFFIDASYGSSLPATYKTAEHLQEYMERNFSCEDLNLIMSYKDFYGLSIQNIRLGNLAVATDEQGKVFRRQAVQYMYDKYGWTALSEVEQWEQVIKEYNLDSNDVTARRQAVDGQIASLDGSKIQVSKEEWVEVDIENPADMVNTKRNQGILLLALQDTDNISNAAFSKSQVASGRQLFQGQGPIAERNREETVPELIMFDEYLLEKCSFHSRELEKSHLKYQVEYILAGKENDLDNLKSVASRLLLLRESANVAYLFSDAGKRAEASALAATVSAVLLLPELQVMLEYSILFAWAFAESIYDVRSLFDGGKVPLLKTDSTWHTDIGVLFEEADETGGKSNSGLSYEDYLRVLLKMTDTDIKTIRMMDMVELDIRKTSGNQSFRMDGCMDGMKIEANIVSNRGYAFVLQRDCCYE